MVKNLKIILLGFLIFINWTGLALGQSQKNLETQIQNFQNKLTYYNKNCVEDITLTYEKCVEKKNAIKKIQETLSIKIETLNSNDQISCQVVESTPNIIKTLSTDISEINTKVTCSEEDKKYYKDQCFDSLKCVMLASGPKIPAMMKFMGEHSSIDFKKFRSRDECLSMNNDCGAKAILGIGKSIQEMVTGMLDLLKMGAGFGFKTSIWLTFKAKEKWDSFWESSSKIEDVTSDIALVASQLSPRNVTKLYLQAELWKLQMMKSMWEGFNVWLNNTVYCGKWSGIPFYSECLRPTTHECSHCGDVLAGNCGLIGLMAVDLVDLFFTGGGAQVGKWTPKLAKGVFGSKKMISILKKNKNLVSKALPLNSTLILKTNNNANYLKAKEIVKLKITEPLKKITNLKLKTNNLKPIKQSEIDLKKIPLDFSRLKKTKKIIDNPKLLASIEEVNIDLETLRSLDIRKNKIIKGEILSPRNKDEVLLEIDNQMKAVNNDFLKKTQKIFVDNGIQSKIVTDKKGVSFLNISLTSKTDNLAQKKFIMLKNKYNANEIAISPYFNSVQKTKGLFTPATNKLIVDVDQVYELLDNQISMVGKHESRHLIFNSYPNKNKKTIYNQLFESNGTLPLNNDGFYNDYVSAEELYNFSTDIGELARRYQSDARIQDLDPLKFAKMIKSEAESTYSIATTIESLTKNNMNKLKDILTEIKTHNLSQTEISKLLNKNSITYKPKENIVLIVDLNGRKTSIPFVTLEEKKLLKNICKASVTSLFTGVDKCDPAKVIKVLELAFEKQKQLNLISEYQKLESQPLIELSKKIMTDKTQNISPILLRSKQFSNNVKESYKGFVGNKNLKPLSKYDFYADASDDFQKIAAIERFMVYASYKKLDKSPSFLNDLNDIHLTGIKKQSGLDISKGRKISAFLKKYPEIEKSELMKLADKKIGVLGVEPLRKPLTTKETIKHLTNEEYNENILKEAFGDDFLFEAFVGDVGIREEISKSFYSLVKQSVGPNSRQDAAIKFYVNRYMDKYDNKVMEVLAKKDLTQKQKSLAMLQELKSLDRSMLNEMNLIRKDFNRPMLETISDENLPKFLDELKTVTPTVAKIKLSPFRYGKKIKFKTSRTTRDIKTIKEIKFSTYNIENLSDQVLVDGAGSSLINSSGINEKMTRLAATMKSSDSDIITVQEVIKPALLEDLSKNYLDDIYKVMIIDTENSHKTAFLVKKDLPLDFELHSFTNLKKKNKTVFGKDLPTLVVYSTGEKEKPLMVISGVHLKSRFVPQNIRKIDDIATKRAEMGKVFDFSDKLHDTQVESILKIKDEVTDFYGDNITYITAGDFNRDAKELGSIKKLQSRMYDSFDSSLQTLPSSQRMTQASNPNMINGQLDGIYGNDFIKKNNLFKKTEVVHAVDKYGVTYKLKESFEKGIPAGSDHSMITTTIDFKKILELSK